MLPTASEYLRISVERSCSVSEVKKRASFVGSDCGSGSRCPPIRPCSQAESEAWSGVAPRWLRRAVQPVVASITNTTARASSARQTFSCGEVSKEVTGRTH